MLKRSTLAVCFLVLIISLGTIMNDQGGLTPVTPNHSESALPASDHSQEHPFHAIDRVRLDEADQRLIELVRERRRMRENYSRSDDSSPNVDFRQQWREHAEKAQTQMHAFQNPVAKPTGDQTPIAPVLSEQDIPSKTLQQVETERLQDWLKDSPREHANFDSAGI